MKLGSLQQNLMPLWFTLVSLLLLGCEAQQLKPTVIDTTKSSQDIHQSNPSTNATIVTTAPVNLTPSQIKANFFKDILRQLSIQVFEHSRQVITINNKTFQIDATHTLDNGSKVGFGVLQRASFYGSLQEGYVHSPDQYVSIPTPIITLRQQLTILKGLHIITTMSQEGFTYKDDRLSYQSKTKECIRHGSHIMDLPIYDEYFFVQGSLPLACGTDGLLTTTEVPIRLNKQVNGFYVMMGGRKDAFAFKKPKPCEEANAHKVDATSPMIPQLSDCLVDKLQVE